MSRTHWDLHGQKGIRGRSRSRSRRTKWRVRFTQMVKNLVGLCSNILGFFFLLLFFGRSSGCWWLMMIIYGWLMMIIYRYMCVCVWFHVGTRAYTSTDEHLNSSLRERRRLRNVLHTSEVPFDSSESSHRPYLPDVPPPPMAKKSRLPMQ